MFILLTTYGHADKLRFSANPTTPLKFLLPLMDKHPVLSRLFIVCLLIAVPALYYVWAAYVR